MLFRSVTELGRDEGEGAEERVAFGDVAAASDFGDDELDHLRREGQPARWGAADASRAMAVLAVVLNACEKVGVAPTTLSLKILGIVLLAPARESAMAKAAHLDMGFTEPKWG